MMMTINNDSLITLLQRGLPFTERPFAEIASRLNVSEEDVLDRISECRRTGLIRRFGGVFNSASLGYTSCLCTIRVPSSDLQRIGSVVSANPGVTHSYVRDHDFNLWFTFTAHRDAYESGLSNLKRNIAPFPLLVLPAMKKYKVQVIFDKSSQSAPSTPLLKEPRPIDLTDQVKRIIRHFQGDIDICADLFGTIANTLDMGRGDLLKELSRLHAQGALKRISAIIRHQQFGFKGNAMCVWRVGEGDIDEAGAALSARQDVSHCYQRRMLPDFPFNLYAMVHAQSVEGVRARFEELSSLPHLRDGMMLLSVNELKKTSPVYMVD
ncbi:MAG: siroheme decarboxylase subunit beta [Planctomycetota bacterium]|jgi:DNA-binding Lrp family transcriptional regulator